MSFNLVIENLLISTEPDKVTQDSQNASMFQSRNRESSYFNSSSFLIVQTPVPPGFNLVIENLLISTPLCSITPFSHPISVSIS